jgi:hypothetical protein
MGKKTKLREAQRARAAEEISALLAAHSKTSAYPALVTRYADFKPSYHEKLAAYRGRAMRAPEKWRCRSKSRGDDERFMDLVRFMFARYAVAGHLASVWLADPDDDFVDRVSPVPAAGGGPRPDLREWFIIAGQGDSLYARAAYPYLSRQETHHFVTAPPALTCTKRAFWYAFARSQTADAQVALDIAQTRLVEFSVASTFWKEAARFFARNPTSVGEMNDLIDFLYASARASADFTLAGRTLPALRRRAEEWHRERRAEDTGCTGAWLGSPLADASYVTGAEGDKLVWRFRQIKTGIGLMLEGERMRHCVARYHGHCMRGDTSIWSLTAEGPHGDRKRRLTIEVSSNGFVGQCRGFANRWPDEVETTMIQRWAAQHGLLA